MRARNIRHLLFRRELKGWLGWITPIFVFLIGFSESAEAFVTLSPSLVLSERYTDNFFFQEIEAERQGEFTTTVGPRLSLAVKERNWDMSARYEGNAEFNARHPGQNRYGQTLGMEIHIPFISESLRGLDLRIIESFAYVPELPAFSYVAGADSLPREANGGVQTGRIQTLRNRAGVLVGYGWTPRISTSLSYSNVITRYQGGALEDVTVHEGGLTGGYRASRQMQWTISYLGSITDYQRSDSVTVHRFTLGNLYQFSPTFAVNLGTGVAVTAGAGAQWTVNAGLTKTEENGSISLQYTRGIGTGGGLTTTATLSQNLIAQINRVLARSTTGFFSLGYGMNDTLSGPTQKIRTQEIGTGIQMTLRSWLSGGINYSYLDQRAEGGATIQDTRRNQVMVTLTAAALPLRIMQ